MSVSSNFQRVFKRPGLYREKVFSGTKEGRPLRWLKLSECLYENKLTPFSEPTADNSVRACSDCLTLTELVRLRGWLYQWKSRAYFLFLIIDSSSRFIRKCMKGWLGAQGSLGRRVDNPFLVGLFRVTFTANGKRESVPRDQVSLNLSSSFHYFYKKVISFTPILSLRIVWSCFSTYFLFWEILNLNQFHSIPFRFSLDVMVIKIKLW